MPFGLWNFRRGINNNPQQQEVNVTNVENTRQINNRDIYIWYSSSSFTTAKALAGILGVRYGKHIPPRNARAVICWGAKLLEEDRMKDLNYLNNMVILNPFSNLQINRDKAKALKTMKEKGVSVPFVCLDNEVDSKINDGSMCFPLIARTKYHQGGEGFELCLCKRDIRRARNKGICHHYVQYIPNDKEYRIHVFNGDIIRMAKKLGREDCNNWRRNHEDGWVFHNMELTETLPNGVKSEAKKAIAAMGLTFGAVDILWSDFDEAVVLEINSAPGLIDNGLEVYSNKIKDYLRTKGVII